MTEQAQTSGASVLDTAKLVAAIVVMGIFFWILDWILGAITRALTGQGG